MLVNACPDVKSQRHLLAEAGDNDLVYEISPRWSDLIPLHRTSSKTPAPNLFLIGCNYARACQNAKKTNRVNESRWKVDPTVLYKLVGRVREPSVSTCCSGCKPSLCVKMRLNATSLRPVSLVLWVKGPDVRPSIMLSHADSPFGPLLCCRLSYGRLS